MRKDQCKVVIPVLVLCFLLQYAFYNIWYNPSQTYDSTTSSPGVTLSVRERDTNTITVVKQVISNTNSAVKATEDDRSRYNIVFYNMPSWMSMEYNTLDSSRCPHHALKHKCFVYTKNNLYDSSKSVIFFGENLPARVPKKNEGQIWTFFSIESPFLYSIPQQWKDKFSWTMTYRRDSDFSYFYGKVNKREIPLIRNYSEIFRKKKKTVAWAVSNCKTSSKREDYIQKLQKYIDVDIYGRCGKLKCGRRSAGVTDCHKKFAEEYKFFLAVENSICKDYTTEKLFNFFFYNLTMIPIVYGPQNVHEYIPKGTFINILDYSSPSELAKDLHRIGSNETLYSEYLREKDKYRGDRFHWEVALCPMCARLHDRKQDGKVSIPDIQSWIWNNTCIKPS
ncbi:glycoprotein 3-alpha-L-fucosyltransferase A-like isoform X1 [Saccostrea echinata]|uniref:glycoprotein 3-alpha-L-fucosyltransferase A-like isoform X1 n=1 Tax=Saccostrea echinata TaxID=191078 RepID=UPI002A833ABA|nr:glycoprotein 3-alpha-L-fucosyltransferase A-like isoform X1 [Saccostrea echinata]XP_061176542.1 glycoprotein 3-alpha-L-fucosyltransferase A-like isoform X1 [Saccostrea echinata]